MDQVVTAVKKLRSRLGYSQQAFANLLRLSVRAIANYEGGRRPSGKALLNLRLVATMYNWPDLAKVFSAAYGDAVKGRIEPLNEAERVLVKIILSLSRNEEFVPDLPRLQTELIASLGALIRLAHENSRVPLKTSLGELEETLAEANDWIAAREDDTLAKQFLLQHNSRISAIVGENADAQPPVRVGARRRRFEKRIKDKKVKP